MIIHKAGPLEANGVQLCVRCGAILNDYRGAMVPVGTPPLSGWAVGAHVEVEGTNPRYSGVTLSDPTCIDRPAFVGFDLATGQDWTVYSCWFCKFKTNAGSKMLEHLRVDHPDGSTERQA